MAHTEHTRRHESTLNSGVPLDSKSTSTLEQQLVQNRQTMRELANTDNNNNNNNNTLQVNTPSIVSVSNTAAATTTISKRHIEAALQDTRPSLSTHERRRLEAIYAELNSSASISVDVDSRQTLV